MSTARRDKYCYDFPRPAVTTDIAVFTIRDDALAVLLIKRGEPPYPGKWALPGGFIGPDETLDECARRELAEETGVDDVYLEQLYSFGDPGRDPRGRTITVAYFALIPSDDVTLAAGTDAADAAWHAVARLPELAFDHDMIIDTARERLRAKLEYSTIALKLIPDEFTLTELQSVYETIQGAPLDKRNFRKRILALGAVEATSKMRQDGAHRPARLYRATSPEEITIIK